MGSGIEFFTATCLKWQNLLKDDSRKQVIMDSLKFLVKDERIWLYAFVVMPNHIHLLWSKQDKWIDSNIQQMFLKYTAQQLKFKLLDEGEEAELQKYRSTQADRQFHFWERRPYSATMYSRRVASQKVDYIHYNPVKKGWCKLPEGYRYSSAAYYELNEDHWGFLTHYEEHI